MNTTTCHRPRRATSASWAAAALVGMLAIFIGPISISGLSQTPGHNSAQRESSLDPATPTGGASNAPAASSPASEQREGTSIRIELLAGNDIATATLEDTLQARDFAAMLPITVDMQDPFGQAKTGLLPRALDLDDPERSRSYATGDLSYWSPSGKIAVVYDDLGRSVPPPGLVRLGTVQTGLRAIASAGNDFTMTIRRGR